MYYDSYIVVKSILVKYIPTISRQIEPSDEISAKPLCIQLLLLPINAGLLGPR